MKHQNVFLDSIFIFTIESFQLRVQISYCVGHQSADLKKKDQKHSLHLKINLQSPQNAVNTTSMASISYFLQKLFLEAFVIWSEVLVMNVWLH